MNKENFIKKYIIISATILLILLGFGLCCWMHFHWLFSFIFSYMLGIANGMLILGVLNDDE